MALGSDCSLIGMPALLVVGGKVSPKPQSSVIKPTGTYGRLHLLGLPEELRLYIWRLIHNDVLLGSEELWIHHPSTAWDGLQLTCWKIHLEIEQFWPLAIVPQAKVDKAFAQPHRMEILNNFRRLSLELPFNKGKAFYESMADTLVDLEYTLEDLRLYFVGKDTFNVKSFVHGCGMRDSLRETSSTKLTIDGQYGRDRRELFKALYFLRHLRTLVINNANYPLLQSMIIKDKPELECLHLSTDPRSSLHRKVDVGGHMHFLKAPLTNFPPVKKLHISTNAALSALQVASKVARTLEELNWTVADVAHQTNDLWPWLQDTSALLDHLGTYAHRLRTLRLCFHAPIYEGHFSEGRLLGGLKTYLPRLSKLECLELHMHSKAYHSGMDIVCEVPNSVRRLYISDKLISAKQLECLMTDIYLSYPYCDHVYVPRPMTLENILMTKSYRYEEARRNGIIGEALEREDYIPFHRAKLGFVSYEYENHPESCGCENCDEAKLTMLRVNGRLLDKERNSYLGVLYDNGEHIWPRKASTDANVGPNNNVVSTHWRKGLSEELRSELEDLDAITEKWDADPNNKFAGYFGTEEEAAETFASEIPVAPEELPERKWPDDAPVGVKEHWHSEAMK